MVFIAYNFKGQVHVFAGQVKIVSHSSCRTSAILKYFCPLSAIIILNMVYYMNSQSNKFYYFFCRRGPVRYKFQGLYELDNLAIVNIRDAGPVKNSFKVLMFPDSKIYQADSSKSKVG